VYYRFSLRFPIHLVIALVRSACIRDNRKGAKYGSTSATYVPQGGNLWVITKAIYLCAAGPKNPEKVRAGQIKEDAASELIRQRGENYVEVF